MNPPVPSHESDLLMRCFFSLLLALFILSVPVLVSAEVSEASSFDEGAFDWWTPHYLVDYALIAGGITGYRIGGGTSARSEALIGPSYDPNNPAAIFGDDSVGATYREEGEDEMVPTVWIHRLIGAGAVFVAGVEAVEWNRGRGSMQQFHDGFVGVAETVALTAALTEVFKPVFGRLRPDFADRARRHHCSIDSAQELGDLCDGYRDRPLSDDPAEARELLEDGRRSFISGHSSHSFNLLGYTALLVGGYYVWGEGVTPRSRSAGIAAQSAMVAAATYISASRLADGRHHRTDVVSGALVGLGMANLSYWRRFNRRGQPRRAVDDDGHISTARLQPSTGFAGFIITVEY